MPRMIGQSRGAQSFLAQRKKICLNGDIVIDHITRPFSVEKFTKFVTFFNLNANANGMISIISYPHL